MVPIPTATSWFKVAAPAPAITLACHLAGTRKDIERAKDEQQLSVKDSLWKLPQSGHSYMATLSYKGAGSVFISNG